MKKIETIDIECQETNGDSLLYHLKLTGKYTVVSGDSGTGKTHLVDLCKTGDISVVATDRYEIISAVSDIGTVHDRILEAEASRVKTLVLLDEALLMEAAVTARKAIRNVVNGSKNPLLKFVLIGRNLSKILPCGAKDIMKIVQTGPNDYTFEREDMIPFRNVNQITCDTVICEDSNNGYTIANAILPKRGFTNVVSASGKDNIPKLMPNYKDEFVAIIMDLCGDAWAYSKLKADYAANQKFFVVDSESFEWECLVCHGTLKRDEPVDTDDFKEYRNEEIYYVKLLAKEIEEFCGLHYTKNNGEKILQLLNNGFFKSELYPELKQIDSGNSGGKDGSTLQKSGLHRFTLSKLELH